MVLSIRKILQNSRGSTAILVLGGMLIFSILGAGLMTISKTSQNTATDYRDGVATEYIAEAGVHDLLAQIKAGAHDPKINDAIHKTGQAVDKLVTISSLQNFSPQPNQTGSYVVTLSKDKDGVFHIRSEATLRSDTTKKTISKAINLTVNLTPNSGGDGDFGNVAGKYVAYANGDFILTNDTIYFFNNSTPSQDDPTPATHIGSNGQYNISGTTKPVVDYAWARAESYIPPYNQYYNTRAIVRDYVHNWKFADPVGVLKVPKVTFDSFSPQPFPTKAEWSKYTDLVAATGGSPVAMKNLTLSESAYYCNGSYTLNSSTLTFTSPNVTLFINGDLSLNIQDAAKIPALYQKTQENSSLTIYVTGSVSLANGAYIGIQDALGKATIKDIQNALPTGSTVNIYTAKTLTMTNAAKIQSGVINIQTVNDLSMSTPSSIIAKDTGSLSLASTTGTLHFTNSSTLYGGQIDVKGYSGILLDNYARFETPGTPKDPQKDPPAGKITITSTNGPVKLTNNSSLLAGDTIKIQSAQACNLTVNAAMNTENIPIDYQTIKKTNGAYANAITRILSNDTNTMQFDNSYAIGGKAVLVTNQGPIVLPGTKDQRNTVFMAGGGISEVTSNSQIGPFYTNGTLRLTSAATLTYNRSVMDTLGLLSSSSGFSATIIKTELEP
ncbi:MAG: hypothetical protein E6713_01680 [Sporomusaceae bacterium]|nr:hypothetical protein [Sporomusaceae bacterium]